MIAFIANFGCQRTIEKGTTMKPIEEQRDRQVDSRIDSRVLKVAVKYGLEKKGWKNEEFGVEYDRQEGHIFVLRLSHVSDQGLASKPFPGGGKSVQIFIDTNEMKVIRELKFQ